MFFYNNSILFTLLFLINGHYALLSGPSTFVTNQLSKIQVWSKEAVKNKITYLHNAYKGLVDYNKALRHERLAYETVSRYAENSVVALVATVLISSYMYMSYVHMVYLEYITENKNLYNKKQQLKSNEDTLNFLAYFYDFSKNPSIPFQKVSFFLSDCSVIADENLKSLIDTSVKHTQQYDQVTHKHISQINIEVEKGVNIMDQALNLVKYHAPYYNLDDKNQLYNDFKNNALQVPQDLNKFLAYLSNIGAKPAWIIPNFKALKQFLMSYRRIYNQLFPRELAILILEFMTGINNLVDRKKIYQSN